VIQSQNPGVPDVVLIGAGILFGFTRSEQRRRVMDRTACLPDRRLRLRARRKSPGHKPMARTFIFPAIGVVAAIVLAASAATDCRSTWSRVFSRRAFCTLAISFWPYMIPFTITIADAAAPHSSLASMFWGEGLFVFPLILVYTAISYSVFRGKVWSASGNY
jgi:cytochrome bd-type quinol oxidase subunit 2